MSLMGLAFLSWATTDASYGKPWWHGDAAAQILSGALIQNRHGTPIIKASLDKPLFKVAFMVPYKCTSKGPFKGSFKETANEQAVLRGPCTGAPEGGVRFTGLSGV